MNILVIKLRGLGDILHTLPSVKSIKKHYNDSYITFLTEKGEEFLRRFDFIDDVIVSYKHTFSDLNRIRKGKFDIVFDFFSTPKTALLSYFSGADRRIGFAHRGRRIFYNIGVKSPDSIIYAPLVNYYLLKAVGINNSYEKVELKLLEQDKDKARLFFNDNNLTQMKPIGISPSATWGTKQWGVKNFVRLCELLHKKGEKVIIIWGKGDESIVRELSSEIKEHILIIPPSSIVEMASFISMCKFIVSNDNFIKHLSVLMGISTITLFGATNEKAWNPLEDSKHIAVYNKEINCRPCDKTFCRIKTFDCMNNILPEEVLNKLPF